MSILHDLKEYGFIGDAGDFIEWFREDGNSDDFLINDYRYLDQDSGNHILIILEEATQELRKPLEISDFVRGPEPKEPNITELYIDVSLEGLEGEEREQEVGILYDNLMKSHKKLHDEWENWTPLFDGWEKVEKDYHAPQYDMLLSRGHDHIAFDKGTIILMSLDQRQRIKSPTKEDFVRLCKSHNIDLLKEVEV